jgi:hypothetical protein
MSAIVKPLNRKAYGSIGHLPGSRMDCNHAKYATGKEVGKDFGVHPGQARICTKKVRDRHDVVIVQEKLDGSCCAAALLDGVIHPLGRAGWPAVSSKYLQHRLFHDWVRTNESRFREVLLDGERLVGEWLAQAHGTQYDLTGREPFVAFDIMRDDRRLPYREFRSRVDGVFRVPPQLSFGDPVSVEDALRHAGDFGFYGAKDVIEGIVYRVERRGEVDFLAKFVRQDKKDGHYLPEMSGGEAVWNWRP